MDARKLAFLCDGDGAGVCDFVCEGVLSCRTGDRLRCFSMLFIVLIANWYGAKTGILVGFCLWTAAVYPGAVCAVAVPGVL